MGFQPFGLSHPGDGVTEHVIVLLAQRLWTVSRIVKPSSSGDLLRRIEKVGVHSLAIAFDDDHLTRFTDVVGKLLENICVHSGILSCFFQGFSITFPFSVRSARINLRRVPCGMITSSI